MSYPRHTYEVEAVRRIAAPAYGPEAFFTEHYREVFPFGKGKPYSTGRAARAAAEAYAAAMSSLASLVMVWECNGSKGYGWPIKDSHERFDSGWSAVKPPTAPHLVPVSVSYQPAVR